MSLHARELAAATAAIEIPDGFHRLHLGANPFIDAVGPFYGRAEGDGHGDGDGRGGGQVHGPGPGPGIVMGLRVQQRHCNPGGTCHGGMLGTLADLLLVLGANVTTGAQRYMVTVKLDCDYLAPAPLGSWLEGRLRVLRATRNLVFCQGLISADGQPVLGLSGIAKPTGEADARFTLAHYLGQPG